MTLAQLKELHARRLAELQGSCVAGPAHTRAGTAKRHCIVTPDIIGPITNGGIGTACFHLARYLRSMGDEVDILFTGPCEIQSNDHWREYYSREYGIGYFAALDFPPLPYQPIHEGRWYMQRSMVIHQWLKGRTYDQIHFQEWQANGFCAMQARRTTGAYPETLLTICLHSSSEWQRQGMRRFPDSGLEDTLLDYCERYAVEHADLAIFPSRHMLEWCETNGWSLPAEKLVVPYHIDVKAKDSRRIEKITELVFFGRLETRKGLEIFVQALTDAARTHPLPRITFMGKFGRTSEGPAEEYLARHLGPSGISYSAITDKSAGECLAYLEESPDAAVVIPSLMDNLPYTVYECIAHGIPLIAARTGGIPEMVRSEDHLFEPTAKSLAERLRQVIDKGLSALPKSKLPETAKELWQRLRGFAPKRNFTAQRPARIIHPADITICIAHYNYGDYLPELLASLDKQTVNGFAVVVVDDGSTDAKSREVFDALSAKYQRAGWTFLRKTNGGIGHTRNFAAAQAKTDYIVFMDADNIAEPHMIERFVHAMGIFDGDVLTCYLRGFKNHPDLAQRSIVYSYMPPGPCLEAGHHVNVFGDANAIVRRCGFLQVGGFGEDRHSSYEDWELLARLALHGCKVDVLPEHLFLYRHTDEGFSRNTSLYLNRARILRAYQDGTPKWAGRMLHAMASGSNPR
jgi:glycosyltransferase involved in cell wall biosynthesis/GT2 family glycosyltransferase